MVFSRRKNARRTFKKPRRRPRRTMRVSKTIKRYVKRTIASNIEDKRQHVRYDLRPIFPTIGVTTSTDSEAIALMPGIAPGGTVDDRIGNRVKLKSLRVRGIVHSNTSDYPNLVKVIIFSRKRIRDMNTGLGTATFGRFLQLGGSATNYDDTIDTFMLPFNKDVITVHDVRTFKIANHSTTSGGSNNDYSTDRMFNMDALKGTKHNFNLVYDDAQNTNLPQNFERWIVAVAVRPGGQTHTAGVNDCNYSFAVDAVWEDM